jgi:hypothetical protein
MSAGDRELIERARRVPEDWPNGQMIRALADRLEAREGWRGIESAKAGQTVMLWIPGFHGAEVCIGVGREYEAYGATLIEWRDRDTGEPFETLTGVVEPTHWMPLPPAPEGT